LPANPRNVLAFSSYPSNPGVSCVPAKPDLRQVRRPAMGPPVPLAGVSQILGTRLEHVDRGGGMASGIEAPIAPWRARPHPILRALNEASRAARSGQYQGLRRAR